MKKIIPLISFGLLTLHLANGQTADYRVVFDMTSRDTINQQSLVREIGLIENENPHARLEVVLYGQGLDLVTKGRCTYEPAVLQLILENKATFKVCAMAMKRNHIDESQLLSGVKVVPDGIYEIMSKQRAGWGYIKVGH